MAEKQESKAVTKGGSKPRSPNYPAVGLEEAAKRVKKLLDADGRAGAPVEAAAKHIGFSGAHGSALVVLSALKKFGLVEDQKGRLVPTQAAVDITTFPPGHPRRMQALRTAVLKPTIYKTIIDQFRTVGQLPSDESLRPELVADRGFTESKVSGFLKDLRASLIYAGLMEGNRLILSGSGGSNGDDDNAADEDETPEGESDVEPENKTDPKKPKAEQKPSTEPAWGGPSVRFDLPRGNAIEIRLKSKVSAEEFRKIKKIFDLSAVAFLADDEDVPDDEAGDE